MQASLPGKRDCLMIGLQNCFHTKERIMFDKDLKEGLMKALNFTPEDLASNRNGMLSDAQKARMGKSAGFTRIASLIMFVVVILIFAAIGAYLFVFSDTGKSFLSGFSKEPTTLY